MDVEAHAANCRVANTIIICTAIRLTAGTKWLSLSQETFAQNVCQILSCTRSIMLPGVIHGILFDAQTSFSRGRRRFFADG